MPSGTLVLVACKDLLFRSKVEETLRHMGLAAQALRPGDEPGAVIVARPFAAAIVDLGMGEDRWRPIVAAARAATPPLPVLAFGSHVDHASQAAARDAGSAIVVANSRLARELPALVERLLASAPSG